MNKKRYIKPESAVLDLLPGDSLLQSSLVPIVADFDTQQIEEVEIVDYTW